MIFEMYNQLEDGTVRWVPAYIDPEHILICSEEKDHPGHSVLSVAGIRVMVKDKPHELQMKLMKMKRDKFKLQNTMTAVIDDANDE